MQAFEMSGWLPSSVSSLAGMEPALVVEGLAGVLIELEVALGDDPSTHHQLAVIGDGNLDTRKGPAD